MAQNAKLISILNLLGNSYVNFTFLNIMYAASKVAKQENKKVLFIDFDIDRAEFSRSFNIENTSKILPIIDKFKKNWTIEKEELLGLIVKNPQIKISGTVVENVDGFFLSGNIAKIGEFFKFDTKFSMEIIKILKEEYDVIFFYQSAEKDSQINKYLIKISDKIISPVLNIPKVLENTVDLVERNNLNEKKLIVFFNMFIKPKTKLEVFVEKFLPVKEVNDDEFLQKLSYYIFKRTMTAEERKDVFFHMTISDRIKEAEALKDTLFSEGRYLDDQEYKTLLEYFINLIRKII